MKLLVIKNQKVEIVETPKATLKNLQDIVGGLIEPFYTNWAEGYTAYCNEEGKLNDFEPSIGLLLEDKLVDVVYGDIVFTGINDDGETVGLTDKAICDIANHFGSKKVVLANENEIIIISSFNID